MSCVIILDTCGYDGIGRHARFRFSCFTACRFDPCYPHQKSASTVRELVDFYFLLLHSSLDSNGRFLVK